MNLGNFGNALKALQLFDEALASYDKAIACVDALDDNLDLMSELSCAIIDQEVKKQEDRYHDLLAELEYLVAASEREINKRRFKFEVQLPVTC